MKRDSVIDRCDGPGEKLFVEGDPRRDRLKS